LFAGFICFLLRKLMINIFLILLVLTSPSFAAARGQRVKSGPKM
jgi:hypothetical protein